jgi:hypothetical protein
MGGREWLGGSNDQFWAHECTRVPRPAAVYCAAYGFDFEGAATCTPTRTRTRGVDRSDAYAAEPLSTCAGTAHTPHAHPLSALLRPQRDVFSAPLTMAALRVCVRERVCLCVCVAAAQRGVVAWPIAMVLRTECAPTRRYPLACCTRAPAHLLPLTRARQSRLVLSSTSCTSPLPKPSCHPRCCAPPYTSRDTTCTHQCMPWSVHGPPACCAL